MSVEASTRVQKKEKNTGSGKQVQAHKVPQATAEQMRLAQLVSDPKDDDQIQISMNIAQIIEITGTSEESASLALYDSSNDPNRAIELILERGAMGEDNGWETAGRKKNRGGTSTTRVVDSFEEEGKEEKTNDVKWERGESRGRGRGGRRGKGRNMDRNRPNDDNDKENENDHDRGKGRRGGRGRGRSSAGRGRGVGRQQGRGAPRHSKNASGIGKRTEGFGSFNHKDSPTEPVEVWKGTDEDNWDIIEVGTWSSEDAQKQRSEKTKTDNSYEDTWGTESWNDDLSESHVFQAQNAQLSSQSSLPGNLTGVVPSQNSNEAMTNHLPNATPQMGERIDLGTLFKKSGTANLQGQTGSDLVSGYGSPANLSYGRSTASPSQQQHAAPDVIQQLQQQGQSNSLFSEGKHSGSSVTSRLFSGYDRPQQQSQSGSQSLFDSNQSQTSVENAYSQFNGKLGSHNQSQSSSSSSFLDSFSGLKAQGNHPQQSGMLGQLTDLQNKQSTLSSYTQVRQQSNATSSVGNHGLNSFSQGQQQQATEAVKASLGIPIGDGTTHGPISSHQVPSELTSSNSLGGLTQPQTESIGQDINKDEPHLSFGSPLPPQLSQQNKQQRRKMPQLPSKIPASAVEMPGSNAYNSQEYVNFSLQFGADDSTSSLESSNPPSDYGVQIPQNGPSGVIAQQNSLFMNNDVTNTNGINSHHSSAGTDSSRFVQSQQKMASMDADVSHSESTRLASQRMNESVMASNTVDQSSRPPPPGLTMPPPESSALASLTAGGNVSHLGSSRLGSDLSSSYSGQPEHMSGGHSLDSSLNQTSSLSSNFPQQVHSYYSSSSLGAQKQNQQMQNDLSGSTGRNLRSPVSSSSLPGSLQSSPMPHGKLMHASGNAPSNDQNSGIGSVSASLPSNIASLATSLSQASISSSASLQQQHHHQVGGGSLHSQSSMLATSLSTASSVSPYSSSLSASANRGMSDPTSVAPMDTGYGQGQDSMSSYSSSYPSTTSISAYDSVVPSSSTLTPSTQLSQTSVPLSTSVGMPASSFNAQSTMAASNSLGGFASSKASQPTSNKAAPNLPQGVTTPILQNQYGIPMAGLLPYTPDMAYGYDQLLLAQSRVINPLNYYDMHFHSNTQSAAINNRDSTSGLGQTTTGQGKFSRGEPSSPTQSTQLSLSGSVGSNLSLSQHNASATHQNAQLKGSQTAGHHSTQQQFVGAMPAYAAGYSSLAPPYYGLGMANTAGFQYPPTMFAAAMHQAPKHSVNTTTGFQQPNAGFSHSYSSAAVTSTASGIPDLQASNYSKTHAHSAFEKQQGYHQQHTNTPPFNLQALTAAVAAGGGAGTGGGAPGLGPYATAPYMTMLQPHQASQQQAIHLLQQQHQDASAGQSIGSQRSLGSNSLSKSASKPSTYGSASSAYWGN